MIKLDTTYAHCETMPEYAGKVAEIHEMLVKKTGKGNDFLGWYDWPTTYDKTEYDLVKKLAGEIREKADVFIVCGIGGSYLGSRAAIEMVQGMFPKREIEILFVGNTFSAPYIVQLLEKIKDKSVVVNVISKSGTTTETAMAFRLLKQFLETKYGKEEARSRIIATTDKVRGTLKDFATKEGYATLSIPDDIGGRYSVLTSVGLLPIAVAGIDVDAILQGALDAANTFNHPDLATNTAYQYAVCRRIMEEKGYAAEMFVSYETQLTMLAEWWKQLFGESEGKEEKGLLPASVNFSTDLHSMGQFIQDGGKCLFETLFLVEKPMLDMVFPTDADDLDHMNYLAGKSLDEVNKKACLGTLEAHHDTGNVPNLILTVPDTSAYTFGYIAQFFFIACAMSVYLLDVNPFNQPGVEVYKKNMFRLLGKI
ncbi:MAG TPA: glucose-6-phosphate isomerase [Erysipelotrichaceae bacterium]|nr:glucose-6-phosphate isomerase [Erysipelotrichaceae bacterium]OGS59231.1 MAG: glucose-6-phosphate isomerase [Firmicutes bacterium GWE2_51_13]HBZ41796.1 glucose-6-phosphate isomerase [Erysipelotrichaceae bacterium]